MKDYAKNFSGNLRRLRKSEHLTQKELADLLQYSEKTISKWECGSCIPDIEVLFEISKVFKIKIENLFSNSDLYFLGIDGGGTKTELALADADGNIIRTYITDCCNPIDIGIKESKRVLENAIYEICDDIPFSSISCFAGIAGGTSADMKDGLKEFFDQFGFRAVDNDSDNKNIIALGLGENDGITVVMGTGVCVFVQKNKKHKRIAGWGYLIDNGGSGYNLGRDALHAYFSAYDKTGAETTLTQEIEKICPGGVQIVVGQIYSGGKKAVASFAPAVFSAIEKGDALAIGILEKNINEVVRFIKVAASEFHLEKIPVVLAGGLTNHEIVVESIKHALNDDRLEIKKLKKSPVYGAVDIAFKLAEKDGE